MLFLIGLILVPLLDQSIKSALRERRGEVLISLGYLGDVRTVHTSIWAARLAGVLAPRILWTTWLGSTAMLAIACVFLPHAGWSAGMLAGASLSHVVETSRRGFICDYVCLRHWPAFNLADVAIGIGAGGLILEIGQVLRHGLS